MTQTLEQALERVRELPDDRQDAIAELIVAELEADRQWERRFAETSDQLELLAKRALERRAEGKAVPTNWDEL
ncbi:MAG: hypothetical protein AAF561_08300 [Planctomycetota bacterium]